MFRGNFSRIIGVMALGYFARRFMKKRGINLKRMAGMPGMNKTDNPR